MDFGTDFQSESLQILSPRKYAKSLKVALFEYLSAKKEVNFVHIFTCHHGIQKLSPRRPPKGASFGAIKNFFF